MASDNRRGGKRPRKNARRAVEHFQPYPGSKHLALQLGGGEVIEAVRTAHDKITAVHRRIAASSTFTFLEQSDFRRLKDAGEALEAQHLWLQVHQLLLLVCRSVAESSCSLFEGISWSIGAMNELTLALTVRALIEQAAAVEFVRSGLADERDRLRSTIWPSLTGGTLPPASLKDRAIHAELLRFAVGRGMDPLDGQVPADAESPSRWRRFYDDLYRRCDELPAQYQPRPVKDYLAPLRDVPGRRHFRAVYKRLCEYSHPNAASRLLDFQVERTGSGRHHVSDRSHAPVSVGFRELFDLAKQVVPAASEMLSSGVAEFSECWMPIPPLDEAESVEEPPSIGSVTAVDQHGRTQHVPLDRISAAVDPKRMVPLTQDQEERVRRLHAALSEFDGSSLDQWLDQFRMDGVYAEEEIRLYERMLRVYRQEIAVRGANNPADRRRVYTAILQSTAARSVEDLVSQMPSLKSMPDLERIFQRVNGPD